MRKSLMMLVAAALVFVPVAISAQTSATSNVTVTATVQRGLSISPTAPSLSFGTVVAGAGTPTIAANGASAIAFSVQGDNAHAIHFTFANQNITSGGNILVFTPEVIGGTTNAQGSATAITSGAGLTLSAADPGLYYVWVGGSLNVVAATPPGSYSGVWQLTVAY